MSQQYLIRNLGYRVPYYQQDNRSSWQRQLVIQEPTVGIKMSDRSLTTPIYQLVGMNAHDSGVFTRSGASKQIDTQKSSVVLNHSTSYSTIVIFNGKQKIHQA